MVALRLAGSSLLKFKLGRLRGHQVVFSRYAQKMISRFLTAAQFNVERHATARHDRLRYTEHLGSRTA
jgi:hypothetical protein